MTGTMDEFGIESEALRTLEDHALRGYPDEVVGALAGHGALVARAVPLANELGAHASTHGFWVSGLARMRVEEALRVEGWEILGYYHSHPDQPAIVSDADLQGRAQGILIIVSVSATAVLEVRVFAGAGEGSRSLHLRTAPDRTEKPERTGRPGAR